MITTSFFKVPPRDWSHDKIHKMLIVSSKIKPGLLDIKGQNFNISEEQPLINLTLTPPPFHLPLLVDLVQGEEGVEALDGDPGVEVPGGQEAGHNNAHNRANIRLVIRTNIRLQSQEINVCCKQQQKLLSL